VISDAEVDEVAARLDAALTRVESAL
jgi:hypothetical protein